MAVFRENRPMLSFHSPRHRLHHGHELKDGALTPSHEAPQRAEIILAQLRGAGLGEVVEPRAYDRSCFVAAHSERFVHFLETAWAQWAAAGRTHDALPLVWPVRELGAGAEPAHIDGRLGYYAMDAGSPITAGTWDAVRSSADCALGAADAVLGGMRAAFALCRPPGHHAGPEYVGGYCYLNNAAIAAESARRHGARRVAIVDVDFHHGNGTQAIFYDRADVFFASLHGDPQWCYPYFSGRAEDRGRGAGDRCTANFPLPPGTGWDAYAAALEQALAQVAAHAADLLVVSLGVDTFEGDPISHFRLRSTDFLRLGARLAKLRMPTVFVMEGGYMVDAIGLNVVNTLRGFEDAA